MSLLTNQEIRAIQSAHPTENDPMPFAQALITATVSKLAQGVSVEPHYHNRIKADGTIVYVPWYTPEQLTTAIAAARVAALEEAITLGVQIRNDWLEVEDHNSAYTAEYLLDAIRALIGKETP